MQVYELTTCVRRANDNAGKVTSVVQFLIYIYTRQRSAFATLSFTPVGDLQATGSSNLLQAHINKGDIQFNGVILHDDIY